MRLGLRLRTRRGWFLLRRGLVLPGRLVGGPLQLDFFTREYRHIGQQAVGRQRHDAVPRLQPRVFIARQQLQGLDRRGQHDGRVQPQAFTDGFGRDNGRQDHAGAFAAYHGGQPLLQVQRVAHGRRDENHRVYRQVAERPQAGGVVKQAVRVRAGDIHRVHVQGDGQQRLIRAAGAVADRVDEHVLQQRALASGGVDGRVAQVDLVGVGTVGIQHQEAVAPRQPFADHAGDDGAAALARRADAHHRQLLLPVDISVVIQHVALGNGRPFDVVHACRVVLGDGRIVPADDGDGEFGLHHRARRVPHGVGEDFGQRVAGIAQRLDLGVVVVHHVAVAAVGGQGQGAEQADGDAADDAACARAGAGAGPHRRHGFRIARVDIGVVVQHVAGRVQARCAVVAAARLDGDGVVRQGHRRIVLPHDKNGDRRLIARALVVADGVGEGIGQDVAQGAQRLDLGQAVVQRVEERAVGLQQQGAVPALQRYPHRARGAGADFQARAYFHDRQGTPFGIGVAQGYVAAGVASAHAPHFITLLDRDGDDGRGHGWVIHAYHGDRQLGLIRQATAVHELVGKAVQQLLARRQRRDGLVGLVRVIGEAAVRRDLQPAVGAINARQAAHGNHRRIRQFGAGAHAVDRLGVAGVHVFVVVQHEAGRVDGCADRGTRRCGGGVVHRLGRVVAAGDGDGQRGGAGQPARIAHRVGEGVV